MCSEVQKQIQLETEITLSFFFFFFFFVFGRGVKNQEKGNQESRIESSRNPDPKMYGIKIPGGRNRRVFRFLKKKGLDLRTQVLLKSSNKPDNTGWNNSTRAIQHFGPILGRLAFKCRQLQVPILPGSDTLQICSPHVCQGLSTKKGTQHTGGTTGSRFPRAVAGQSREQKGGPQTHHLSRVQTSVSAGIWTLNTLRFLLPIWEIRVKEEPSIPGIWWFPAPTNPLSPVIWSKYKPLPGFVKEAEKCLWLFDSF
jgi:hypothetical protein